MTAEKRVYEDEWLSDALCQSIELKAPLELRCPDVWLWRISHGGSSYARNTAGLSTAQTMKLSAPVEMTQLRPVREQIYATRGPF